jgi:hypothetical protein
VQLRRPDRRSRLGFIAYLAVHRDGALLDGWLTAAFLADDFMRGLLGDGPPGARVRGPRRRPPTPEALLYSTAGLAETGLPVPLSDDGAALSTTSASSTLPGRTWTLRYRATPEFSPLTDRLAPWLIVLSGLFAVDPVPRDVPGQLSLQVRGPAVTPDPCA